MKTEMRAQCIYHISSLYLAPSSLMAAGRDVKMKEGRQWEFIKYMTSLLHHITLWGCQLLLTRGTAASPTITFCDESFCISELFLHTCSFIHFPSHGVTDVKIDEISCMLSFRIQLLDLYFHKDSHMHRNRHSYCHINKHDKDSTHTGSFGLILI